LYASPFRRPIDLDEAAWTRWAENLVDACLQEHGEAAFDHVSTGNVARDMDALREALGDEQLSYLGFSYGSFLGATYASLFPHNYRALVLDGALDANQYINRPSEGLRAQTAGFERALDRFFEACAGNAEACFGFGGGDPHLAFDRLVAAAHASPFELPATGQTLDGDDILAGTLIALYAKQASYSHDGWLEPEPFRQALIRQGLGSRGGPRCSRGCRRGEPHAAERDHGAQHL
jgi:pimeloyl-ACP methyl ester carboxylesterase